MQSQIYLVNGLYLNVWYAGPNDGPVILFLHGFPEAGFAWEAQLRFFAALGYRVLAPDQRGYNLSYKPQGVTAYRMAALVADMVDLIRVAGAGKVVLVGHDWGGGVAWHLALEHPELVHRLVILNMPHPRVMHHQLAHNWQQRRKSSYAALFQLPLIPEWAARRNHFRLLEQALCSSSLRRTFSGRMLERYKNAWNEPGALTGMINWYRAYRFSEAGSAGEVQVPVKIIWGRKDAFLAPQMAAQSAQCCARATVVVLDKATHWLHHEFPEEINEQVRSFLPSSVY